MSRRIPIIAIFTVLLLVASAISGIWKYFVVNVNSVALLAVSPSLGVLQPYWHGAGLRSVSEQENKQLFSVHASLSDQAYCQGWERDDFSTMLRSGSCTGCDTSTLALLIEARRQECDGNLDEALTTLDKVPGRFDAQKIGIYKAFDRISDGNTTLQSGLCSSPPEWWCIGYIDYLWHVWYSAEEDAQSQTNPTRDVPNGLKLTSRDPRLQYDRWKLEGYWGVQVEREVPLVITDALPLRQEGNYLAYVPVASHGQQKIEQRIIGQVTPLSLCEIYGAVVFWREHGADYISERAQAFPVSEQFEIFFSSNIPEGTSSVTPRILFSDTCFDEAHQVTIYDVYLRIYAD